MTCQLYFGPKVKSLIDAAFMLCYCNHNIITYELQSQWNFAVMNMQNMYF